jgi:uncharacterized membrane protein
LRQKKLQALLLRWVEQGFISTEQQERIRSYEGDQSRTSRGKWVLFGLLGTGAAVIGIGIISLIAANWKSIPGSVKLLIDVSVLAGVALAVYRAGEEKKELLFDALTTLFMLLCLASVGLISQIFHIGVSFHSALFLTLLTTFPLTLFTHRQLIPHLWVAGLWAAIIFSVLEGDTFSQWVFVSRDDEFLLFLTIPLLAIVLYNLAGRWKQTERFTPAFLHSVFAAGLICIGALDIALVASRIKFGLGSFLVPVVLAVLAGVAIVFQKDLHSKAKAIVCTLIGLCVAFHLPWVLFEFRRLPAGDVLGPIYSILSLLLLAALFVLLDRRKLFNAITILIGIRFLFVYFQVIGDLAKTGFGLIVSGCFIIGLGYLWHRTKDRVEVWIGEALK